MSYITSCTINVDEQIPVVLYWHEDKLTSPSTNLILVLLLVVVDSMTEHNIGQAHKYAM